MASTYKAYLGEGLGFLANWLLPLKIPHPGKVGGYVAMNLTMPAMLAWVLGGNLDAFKEADRNPLCHLNDKPKFFDQADFRKFLKDDAALQRASKARWLVVPTITQSLWHSQKVDGDAPPPTTDSDAKNEGSFHLNAGTHVHGLRIALPEEATEICPDKGLVFGKGIDCSITLDHPSVSTLHAKIAQTDGDYYLSDMGSANGTWLNGTKMKKQEKQRVTPGDEISIGQRGVSDLTYKIKQVHNSVWDQLMKLEPNPEEAQKKDTKKEEKKEAVAA